MGVPRLSDSNERKRQTVVESLRPLQLRDAPQLDRIASAIAARFDGELPDTCRDRVLEADEEIRECVELLDVDQPSSASRLGFEDTDLSDG